MGRKNERGDYWRIFSKCRKKTGSESKLKPKSNNNYDRPWNIRSYLHRLKLYEVQSVHVNTAYKQQIIWFSSAIG